MAAHLVIRIPQYGKDTILPLSDEHDGQGLQIRMHQTFPLQCRQLHSERFCWASAIFLRKLQKNRCNPMGSVPILSQRFYGKSQTLEKLLTANGP